MTTAFAEGTKTQGTFKLSKETVDNVIAKLKELVREGNVRRLIVKNAEGETIIVVPLTVGVVTTALLPVWTAIAAVAALAAEFTIDVEGAPEQA